MSTQAQQPLITRLKSWDNHAIRELYTANFHYCASTVLKNSGNQEDAKEIFQEALLVLYRNLQRPEFSIGTNLKSYLFGICRNLWLKKLRTDRKTGLRLIVDEPESEFADLPSDDGSQYAERETLYSLLEQALRNLSEDCRKLIKLFFYEKLTYREVAKRVDFQESYIRKKKKNCIDKIKKEVKTRMQTL